jgi:competence protein ComEA
MIDMSAGLKRGSTFRGESGVAVILVLVVMALLSTIGLELARTVRSELKLMTGYVEDVKAFWLAKSGVNKAIAVLALDDRSVDSLKDQWAEDLSEEMEDGSFSINLSDEASKINLNTADRELIYKLLSKAGLEESTANSISQEIIQRRSQKPFRTIYEILTIEGMDENTFYGNGENPGLADLITVWSYDENVDAEGRNRTNINTASAATLDSDLGEYITRGEAQAIVDYRRNRQFQSIGELMDVPALTQQQLNSIRDRITVSDEQGGQQQQQKRLNINTATVQQLVSVLGLDPGIAQDIVDYRERNGPFRRVEDLLNVRVVTREKMKRIADRVTTSSERMIRGLLNVNTSSSSLLGLLPGMNEEVARAIVDRRDSQGPFRNLGDLLDVNVVTDDIFRRIAPYLTTRSGQFRIESTGTVERGERTFSKKVMAVLSRVGGIRVIYWKERF